MFSEAWKRCLDTAEHQMIIIGNTGGMGTNLSLENDDFTLWQALSQMIVGSAIAEPEFQDNAVYTAYGLRGEVKAGTLRLQATDKAIQPAQINVSMCSPMVASSG